MDPVLTPPPPPPKKKKERIKVRKIYINPLSPSDQYQISPCNDNAYSTPEVMRIKDMITQVEFSWYFNDLSTVPWKEKHGGQDRWICSLKLGVKGLTSNYICIN